MNKWWIIGIGGGLLVTSGIGVLLFKKFAPFQATITELPESMEQKMIGVSWTEGCPLALDELVLVKVRHYGFNGLTKTGKMIVARDVAPSLVEAFRELYALKFPIQQIRPIDEFEASDPISMRNNNTSVFRCSEREHAAHDRRGTWSEHTRAQAIDVNPLYNPFVMRSGEVQPIEGAEYANRDIHVKGMVTPEVVDIFKKYGWKWGGNWSSSKDYQHFSIGGR